MKPQKHADAILIGEAESVWSGLITDLKTNNLKPRYDARNMTFDFANSPMPRFDLLDINRYNRLTVYS